MASCRAHSGVNENVETYGDVTKDFQEGELTLWEELYDVDLRAGTGTDTTEVLEVYAEGGGNGLWDDGDELDGATCDATHFRVIRAASGEGHSGIPYDDGTVAGFRQIADGDSILRLKESYSQIQDLVGKITKEQDANPIYVFRCDSGYDYHKIIGCMAFDSENTGTNVSHGFLGFNTHSIINCLAHNITGNGFHVGPANDNALFIYNCTSTNNTIGFNDVGIGGIPLSKNCLADGNTTDFSGTWADNTNMSSDATSPTVALRNQTNVFVNAAGDDFHLAVGDDAVDAGTDLSGDGNFAFDDDINDGVMGAGKAGETRTGTWDIGFDEYMVVGVAPTAVLYGPLVGPLGGPI